MCACVFLRVLPIITILLLYGTVLLFTKKIRSREDACSSRNVRQMLAKRFYLDFGVNTRIFIIVVYNNVYFASTVSTVNTVYMSALRVRVSPGFRIVWRGGEGCGGDTAAAVNIWKHGAIIITLLSDKLSWRALRRRGTCLPTRPRATLGERTPGIECRWKGHDVAHQRRTRDVRFRPLDDARGKQPDSKRRLVRPEFFFRGIYVNKNKKIRSGQLAPNLPA